MKLTNKNYFSREANLKYMSSSQYKGFVKCEAQQMALISGEFEQEEKPCFLVGKYVHAFNEGTLDKFQDEHPEIFCSRGERKGELKAEFLKANEGAIKTIQEEPLFTLALAGEKEKIFTAELFGCEWKVMLDSYDKKNKRFTDLKVVKALDSKEWDNESGSYMHFLEYYGYSTTKAIYAEIERRANNRATYFEPFVALVTKQKYPDKELVSYVSENESVAEFVANRLALVEYNMPRILSVKNGEEAPRRCGSCDYCRKTKKLTGTKHYSQFNLY